MIIIYSKPFIFLKSAQHARTQCAGFDYYYLPYLNLNTRKSVWVFVYRKMELCKAKLIHAKSNHSPDDFSCMHIFVFLRKRMGVGWGFQWNSIHCLARVTDLTGEKNPIWHIFAWVSGDFMSILLPPHIFFTRSANWKIDVANMNHTHNLPTTQTCHRANNTRDWWNTHRFVVGIPVFSLSLAKNRTLNYYYT